jgi:ABC-type multidrug transport system fused ATPase/permease subunit
MNSDSAAAPLVLRSVREFTTRRPLITAGYVIGILAAVFFRGFSVEADAVANYERALRKANQVPVYNQQLELAKAEEAAYRARGWFSCDATCQRLERQAQRIREELAEMETRREQGLKEAKREIGLWSRIGGVGEMRELFWNAWDRGTATAQRMTAYDAISIALFGGSKRDETLLSVLFQIFLRFLINLTIGLIATTGIFLVQAVSVVNSYGPDLVSGIIFYGLVVCASLASLATFLGLFYTGVGLGVHQMAKSIENQERRRRGRLHID